LGEAGREKGREIEKGDLGKGNRKKAKENETQTGRRILIVYEVRNRNVINNWRIIQVDIW
jgi:hypothetical protein